MKKLKYPYGKNVLITGASSGIGKECATLFANNGYTVYAISRSIKEEQVSLGKGTIIALKADVTDIASIEKLKEHISSLNMIIHCAGFGIAGSAEDMPIDMVKAQFETNYFGVLNVNKVFMPVLRENKTSLVIGITSIAGKVTIPFQSHYSSTKYALEAYFQALGMEAKDFGVKVSIIEPGDLQTGFTAQRKSQNLENSPYKEKATKAILAMEDDENNGAHPSTIAKIALKISEKKNPPVRVAAGFVYKFLMFIIRIVPDKLVNKILSSMYKIN